VKETTMAHLTFIGTAPALPSATRTNTSLAIVPQSGRQGSGILIDCGGDVYSSMLRSQLEPDSISDLFISHAHIDHIGSLPSLLESFRLGGRRSALAIWALPEVMAVARGLIKAFDFELKLDQWSYEISFREVRHGDSITLAGVPASTFAMDHTVPTLGVRLELPGGVLAYTSDTQPNPHICDQLARGASTLITECTFLSARQDLARSSKHLTAYEAGELAAACGAKRLVLVHLGPPPDEIRVEASQVFHGEVVIPQDGDSIEL
jgi:ribonuclease BN (tRNA processing enzyme)